MTKPQTKPATMSRICGNCIHFSRVYSDMAFGECIEQPDTHNRPKTVLESDMCDVGKFMCRRGTE